MRLLPHSLCVLALLAACDGSVPASNPAADGGGKRSLLSGGGAATAKPPLARISLAGGDVVVAGPDGYCLDPATSKSAAGRGFAVIASCLILSQGKVGRGVAPVIVTVTVGPRGDMADLPNAKALAEAAGAPLVDAPSADGLVMAHLGSGGDSQLENGDSHYWRGAFVQGGRLVGLALYAPAGDAMARGSRGAQMLERVRSSIRKASGGPAAAVGQTAVAMPASGAVAANRTVPVAKPAKANVLSRLFGG